MANSDPDARLHAASLPGKIALEEHFLCLGLEEYWTSTVANVEPQVLKTLAARLYDFDELRIRAMDEAGIARSVLSVSGPGVQAERNPLPMPALR